MYSYTINRRAWVPDLEVPFVLAAVELDEQPGLRLITTLVDCAPEDVEIRADKVRGHVRVAR